MTGPVVVRRRGEQHPAALEPEALRAVFGSYPTGVVVLAALVDGQPTGLVASSFVSVSLVPPLVSACVAHSSRTWPLLRAAPRLGVSVLSAEQERAGRQLSGSAIDRFADVDWQSNQDGAVVVDGAAAWLEVSVTSQVPAGDHDIVVLAVHDLAARHGIAPLVFHASRFTRLR